MLFVCILLGGLLYLQGAALGTDGDAGWTLRLGEITLTQGLPRTEPLLSGMLGQPAVQWEWLAQVTYALAYRLGGLNGGTAGWDTPTYNFGPVRRPSAVLDAASIMASSVNLERQVQAEICIRAGYLALRRISDYFGIPYDPDPKPDDPISVPDDAGASDLAVLRGAAAQLDGHLGRLPALGQELRDLGDVARAPGRHRRVVPGELTGGRCLGHGSRTPGGSG